MKKQQKLFCSKLHTNGIKLITDLTALSPPMYLQACDLCLKWDANDASRFANMAPHIAYLNVLDSANFAHDERLAINQVANDVVFHECTRRTLSVSRLKACALLPIGICFFQLESVSSQESVIVEF